MKKFFCTKNLPLVIVCFVMTGNAVAQNTNADEYLPAWLTHPLSLTDCLNIALQQNATILEAQNDLQASYGVVVQTRAVALPQVQATGQYKDTDPNAIESYPGTSEPNQNWNAGVQSHKGTGAGAISDDGGRHVVVHTRGVLRRAARRAANHRA
jgi:outer membrane protein TolC